MLIPAFRMHLGPAAETDRRPGPGGFQGGGQWPYGASHPAAAPGPPARPHSGESRPARSPRNTANHGADNVDVAQKLRRWRRSASTTQTGHAA